MMADRKSTRLNSSHSQISYAVSLDRKSTRLNSSHSQISYAVFCLKKKTPLNSIHSQISDDGLRLTKKTTRADLRKPSDRLRHNTCLQYTCLVISYILHCRMLTSFVYSRHVFHPHYIHGLNSCSFFFFNDTATTEILTLSQPGALLFLSEEHTSELHSQSNLVCLII